MLQKSIVEFCSPTLAGIKTGSLFSVKKSPEDIVDEIRGLNKALVGKGIRIIPIKKSENNTLIYVYRPDRLKNDLCKPEASCILKEKGYSS